jgi:hypothetical protein
MKNFTFSTFIIVFLILLSSIAYAQVTGNAFLQDQSDHSGIKIVFYPFSPTAKLDSTNTNSDGNFSINLKGGLYKITYSRIGYHNVLYHNGDTLPVAESQCLENITLLPDSIIILSGKISGTLKKNVQYIVDGDAHIEIDAPLTIEPGAIIKFKNNSSFTSNGTLIAEGTETEPIIFTSYYENPNPADWLGINLRNVNSKINNCIIEYCSDCISCTFSNSEITNNKIRYFKGTGITVTDASPIIKNNFIYGVDEYKDTIKSTNGILVNGKSSVKIECNKIVNGICFCINLKTTGSVEIVNNIIGNNILKGYSFGVGFGIWDNFTALKEIKIINNYFFKCIYSLGLAYTTTLYFLNNTVSNNVEGIELNKSVISIIKNNIFINNYSKAICSPETSQTLNKEITHNLFWNNYSNFYDIPTIGLGTIVTTNQNGDSIDSYFNLYQDPKFVNDTPPRLSDDSPCWNAGHPDYWSFIGYNIDSVCSDAPFVSVPINNYNNKRKDNVLSYPNPFKNIINIEFTLLKDSYIKIILFDLTGKELKTVLNDYRISGKYTIPIELNGLQSGIYFYTIMTRDYIVTKKIVRE